MATKCRQRATRLAPLPSRLSMTRSLSWTLSTRSPTRIPPSSCSCCATTSRSGRPTNRKGELDWQHGPVAQVTPGGGVPVQTSLTEVGVSGTYQAGVRDAPGYALEIRTTIVGCGMGVPDWLGARGRRAAEIGLVK